MADLKEHLKDISEIRGLMERNSKFLSLSGLSGISSGLIALIGSAAAWLRAGLIPRNPYITGGDRELVAFLIMDALFVLVGALGFSFFFSVRMARRQKLPFWGKSGQHMLLNLLVPVGAGAILCFIQLGRSEFEYLASTMLIFYGMALLSASKFTLGEIRWLGLIQIVLGLIAAAWPNSGYLLWTFGFGILHIVYGSVMYWKYER